MKRRSLFQGLFGAAAVAVAARLPVQLPVKPPKVAWGIEGFMRAEVMRVRPEIFRRTLSESPWVKLINEEND
jgi:hypothetical protein